MKNLLYILLFVPLFFISSCEEDEETQSGYNCISNTCSAVFENPQYLTLVDCQSVCEDVTPPAGYICVSNNCISVFENPLYTTLSECQSACSENIGCIDESACNYDETASVNDSSCEYAEQGYDCNGSIDVQVGDEALGGIVFYIDESGVHGFVAAMEDIEQGATDPSGYEYDGYEWGCYFVEFDGASGQWFGTGYQNTLDIVNQECETEYGGLTAAKAAYDAEINNYSDWYLPSFHELEEIYNAIGNEGPEGNIGGPAFGWYWSSSSDDGAQSYKAWPINFSNQTNIISSYSKDNIMRVRPIRSF